MGLARIDQPILSVNPLLEVLCAGHRARPTRGAPQTARSSLLEVLRAGYCARMMGKVI